MTSSVDPLLSDDNPYAPPASRDHAVPLEPGSPEQIRTEHLTTEADIQSIGTAVMLMSLVVILIGFTAAPRASTPAHVAASAGWIVGGFVLGNFGKAVHRLRPWTRWPMVILALPPLLLFPLGTSLSSLVLIRMLSRKGKTVLTREYAEIIQQTPDIRFRYSLLTRVLVLFLVMLALLVSILLFA